jgi:hypothetical protein
MLVAATFVLTFALNSAEAGLPPPPGFLIPPGLPGSSVNVTVDGYLPAPPGVQVRVDSGRPYYVERDRRVYMEKRKPGKHYKKEKKHHEDNGRRHGHDKHNGHDD